MDYSFLKNIPEFTVSGISIAIRNVVEESFDLVRVRGEISGYRPASSGHVYFSLKDEDAVLNAICWRGTAAKLPFKPEDGMEVIITGRVTTYSKNRSEYQIIVDTMEVAGQGTLLALIEKRKQALAAEGLFDESRKKERPFLPERIAVITSPTGAVIRDILHRLEDRFPRPVLLYPVPVQGAEAAAKITEAITDLNTITPRPDLIIIARGGGSIEDLMPFNEENVVRAVAASDIPIISAIGHETDTTLIDYAADLRAPTPTAAAEMAVPVQKELYAYTQDLVARLHRRTFLTLSDAQSSLNSIRLRAPTNLLETLTQRLDYATNFLESHKTKILEKKEEKLTRLSGLLESYSYRKTLNRGFALVQNKKGKIVTSAAQLQAGDPLNITLSDETDVAVTVDRQGQLL
ncbi:MAG: exodeoxyribonuclease VII large subunit [Alphaproteobacteria bacterium]